MGAHCTIKSPPPAIKINPPLLPTPLINVLICRQRQGNVTWKKIYEQCQTKNVLMYDAALKVRVGEIVYISLRFQDKRRSV